MAKYKVDWSKIKKDEAPALIEATARYLSGNNYPSIESMKSILGIMEESDESCTTENVHTAETI